ncbi:cytochrome-c peroxidase [Rhizobium oryzicola]|uniref:Cytochrome-c peroxidase n=1 Tax=Rhizobium oryzicola TaxID=1232668 RepID=A0ABT8STT7_9HYPH|nr:cytochrome-c peroxidase [Rhizobium oryzicola]MDO1581436.1 cytochrome-c peroxidase [Rhizobium oryzicola]
MLTKRFARTLCLSAIVFSATLSIGAVAVVRQGQAAAPAFPVGLHPGPMSRPEAFARAEALAALGKKMFSDPSLSASGQEGCSTCHEPARGFGYGRIDPVVMGGPAMDQPGVRAVPSLRYLQATPQFTEHYFESEDEADESIDNGPTGGLTWDGRVDGGAEQAKIPLLAPNEMANRDAGDVAKSLAAASYASEFKAVFGSDIFEKPEDALEAAVKSLAAFEQTPDLFYPYSSRYDAYLAGKAELTAQEKHGLELFQDEKKGNCSSCHISERANDGSPPQFSDFGMLGLAVPRNPAIPANADPAYHDLGLCGPYRTDFKDRPDYCGLFRTPTLRNVALKKSFFHNGVFHDLRDAVAFYATRDTDPGHWYSKNADGSVNQYDDLPKEYWANLNQDAPFGKKPGDTPALTDAEIDDIVAFLKTLTDADLVGVAEAR